MDQPITQKHAAQIILMTQILTTLARPFLVSMNESIVSTPADSDQARALAAKVNTYQGAVAMLEQLHADLTALASDSVEPKTDETNIVD